MQFKRNDREIIDMAIRNVIGPIEGLNDDDRLDYMIDDVDVFDSAVGMHLEPSTIERISNEFDMESK